MAANSDNLRVYAANGMQKIGDQMVPTIVSATQPPNVADGTLWVTKAGALSVIVSGVAHEMVNTLPNQIIRMHWSTTNASSGNQYLFSGKSNQMTSGVAAYGQQMVPRNMTLVRWEVTYQVTAWTSGNSQLRIYNSAEIIWEQSLTDPTGVGDYRETGDVTPGTVDWSEDDYVICLFDHNSEGVATVDDVNLMLYFQLDDLWIPA